MRPGFKAVLYGTIIFAVISITINFIFQQPHTSFAIWKIIISSVVSGFILSFFFGFLADRFVNLKAFKESMKPTDILQPGEKVIFEAGANHFVNGEGVGGKIFVTDHNIIFRSHKYNIQKHTLVIPLSDISRIKPTRSFGLINNGLTVITTPGKKEKFVVAERKKLLEIIPASLQGII